MHFSNLDPSLTLRVTKKAVLKKLLGLCESLFCSQKIKCSAGALACDYIRAGRPRAAVPHETLAELSF
jgi:hypothetical protein